MLRNVESENWPEMASGQTQVEILLEDGHYIDRDQAIAYTFDLLNDLETWIFVYGVGFNNNCDTWAKSKRVFIKMKSGKISEVYGGFLDEWFHHIRFKNGEVQEELLTKEARIGLALPKNGPKEVATIDPGVTGWVKKFKALHDHLFEYIYLDEDIIEWNGRLVPCRGIQLTNKGKEAMGSELVYTSGESYPEIHKHVVEALWEYFHV
jgi:hypothetical protein